MLPLHLVDPKDYERIREGDRVSIVGLKELAPSRPVKVILAHADGSRDEIACRHSFNAEQLAWFRAGSALNVLRGKR